MTMRTTIKLTWHTDLSMEDYAEALQDITHAIVRNKERITDVRWGTDPVQATKERKIRKPKKEPYEPPAERSGESAEE